MVMNKVAGAVLAASCVWAVTADTIVFKSGSRLEGSIVRIVGGEWDGVEGVFARLAGHRSRCVVVEIPMVASVATATISPDQIEIVEE